jgi:uncharacterized protein
VTGADLHAVLALQEVDTALDQLRHRRAHLPEQAELAAIDREGAALEKGAGGLRAGRDELAAREAAVEADLASTEARAEAVNQRLYGGGVSASRELQAMAADVEALKARASVLEDQALELMEEREPLDAQLAQLTGQLDALRARRRSVSAAATEATAGIDEELRQREVARAEAARAIPPDLLATYDQLRTRLAGVAVARLIGNHCDGCHLALPAMELDRIRRLGPGEVVTCEQCGRILVHD